MRSSWLGTIAVLASSAVVHAEPPARAYIERFVGWSKDGSYYVITEAGTDEMALPAFCVSRRGDKPATWPKDIALPDKDDDRGCTETPDDIFDVKEAETSVAKASSFVVSPASAGKHNETIAIRTAGDGTIAEITVSQGKKPVGRGFLFLRNKSAVPRELTSYWRDDGLAVAVEAGFPPTNGDNPGFGPPSYLVVIPLDGSTANASRPKTEHEQAVALNLEGMKLLKANRLAEAQTQFVAAAAADPSFSIAHYNLASVASLRQDTNTAVTAIGKVIELAKSDPVAKKALAKAKTDHDLDFIASESPYVTKLLGRPRIKGDDWCVAAEKRAREMSVGNFVALAEQAKPLLDPSAVRAGLPAGKDPEFRCHVRDGASQFSITMFVALTDKEKRERTMRIGWEIFPDGLFDADAFPDENQPSKTIRLKKLEQVATISQRIAAGK